ncbi:MAG: cell envelope integrity protein TolA [Rubrivivax sp.]|nr:cell envelope integrity protein TolA [Rubrivivax sp.]
MTAAALRQDTLLPRPPGGNGAGAVLALLVHGVLLLALTTAVEWRTHTPDVVSAELWASVPRIAAPQAAAAPEPTPTPTPAPEPKPEPAPAPTPAPPPPPPVAPRAETRPAEPDIATARAERRKAEAEAEARKVAEAERRQANLERRKAEVEARKRAEEDQRRAAADKARQEAAARKADDERLARQREENLKRIMGQAAGTTSVSGGTGSAAQSAAPSAAYAGLVAARVRPNIVYTGTISGNAAAEVEVRAAPGGTIIARRLVKSSGHPDWDAAVLRALDRTPALPRDADGRVPSTLIIAFRPNE